MSKRQKANSQKPRQSHQGFTHLFLGLAILVCSYLFATVGMGILYHNLGSLSLSKGLLATESQAQIKFLQQANSYFWKALDWNAENKLAYANLGDIYLTWEQASDAREAFEQVIKLVPDDPYANYQLGFLYDKLGQENAANIAWQKTGNAQIMLRQGLACRGQGLDICAERFYKLALSIQSDYADAYYYLGMLYATQERDAEVIEAYTKAMQYLPKETEKSYLTQARLYAYAQKWEQAITAYQQAIEIDPNDADTYIQIAIILLGQFQDEKGAVEWYLAAIQADPQTPAPYLRLANFYWSRQDWSRAALWYQRAANVATASSETLARAQMGLSRSLWQQGNLEGALQAAQTAVDAQPSTASYHILLADIYAELQDSEKAITSYQAALALDPENKRAQRQIELLGGKEP